MNKGKIKQTFKDIVTVAIAVFIILGFILLVRNKAIYYTNFLFGGCFLGIICKS